IEGTSNGVPADAIAFARNGRAFAVVSIGATSQDDGSRFARFVVGLAESTPIRSDAKPVQRLRPAAVASAAPIPPGPARLAGGGPGCGASSGREGTREGAVGAKPRRPGPWDRHPISRSP